MPRLPAASSAALIAVALGAALAVAAPVKAQAPAPGFQVDLAGPGRAHLECFVSRGRLRCLNYSRATAPGRCDFGGDVPMVELARRGKAQITYTCVDEGFHGWKRLAGSETFRSGPFRCRPRGARTTLRCVSTVSGWSFSITSRGRVLRGR